MISYYEAVRAADPRRYPEGLRDYARRDLREDSPGWLVVLWTRERRRERSDRPARALQGRLPAAIVAIPRHFLRTSRAAGDGCEGSALYALSADE